MVTRDWVAVKAECVCVGGLKVGSGSAVIGHKASLTAEISGSDRLCCGTFGEPLNRGERPENQVLGSFAWELSGPRRERAEHRGETRRGQTGAAGEMAAEGRTGSWVYDRRLVKSSGRRLDEPDRLKSSGRGWTSPVIDEGRGWLGGLGRRWWGGERVEQDGRVDDDSRERKESGGGVGVGGGGL